MIPRLDCQNFKGGPRVRDFRRSLRSSPKKERGGEESGLIFRTAAGNGA